MDNVSFAVEEGEIFGLIGPNGSGKTTAFNLISYAYPVTSGNVIFKGQGITGLKTYQVMLIRRGALLPGSQVLEAHAVLDNMIASAFLRHTSMKDARTQTEKWLDFCGLTTYAGHLARGLSIASRKRLEITRAMATEPRLLLLDETAAGLNHGELDEAIALILKICQSGVTIVIVKHIMKMIMSISDRIHCINHSQTIADGEPQKLAQDPNVIEAYLGYSGGELIVGC